MSDKDKEKLLVCLIIAFSILTFLFALLSASTFFALAALSSAMVVVFTGGVIEVMIKLKKWKWASSTEQFDDGSLTRMKMSVAAAWGFYRFLSGNRSAASI